MKKTLKGTQKSLTQEKFVNYMCDLQERQGGITLIALVITIVVLLILAGVSVATLTRRKPEY